MRRSVVVFVVITFALSIGFSVAVSLTGGHANPFLFLSVITMFFPAIAVMAVMTVFNERPFIKGKVFTARYLLLALFLMPATMHAVMLTMTIHFTRGLPWQTWLTPQSDHRFHAPPELGWGVLTPAELGIPMVVNAITGLMIVTLLAFFEEIGWRAWLLPRLRQQMSEQRSIVTVAVLWALWHVPFVLSGVTHLPHVPVSTAAFILPLGDFGAGLVIGWLWMRTGNVWLVSLAHGALNNWG